jgi:hypothetical protein
MTNSCRRKPLARGKLSKDIRGTIFYRRTTYRSKRPEDIWRFAGGKADTIPIPLLRSYEVGWNIPGSKYVLETDTKLLLKQQPTAGVGIRAWRVVGELHKPIAVIDADGHLAQCGDTDKSGHFHIQIFAQRRC